MKHDKARGEAKTWRKAKKVGEMRKRREGGKAEILSATLENRASTSWAFAVMYYSMIPTTRNEIGNGNRYAMAMIWQETTGNDLLIREDTGTWRKCAMIAISFHRRTARASFIGLRGFDNCHGRELRLPWSGQRN